MTRLKPVQILLVQHDENDVKDFRSALNKLELYYELSWAKNDVEAIALLQYKTHRKLLPDMMLIDYQLPDYNWSDLLKIVRNKEQWRQFPCFLLVNRDISFNWKPPDIPGLSGYISKPFSVSGPASSGSLKMVMDLINRSTLKL